MLLSPPNAKLRKSVGKDTLVMSFGLPAGSTCPNAGDCLKGCYAQAGSYRFPAVIKKRAENLAATKLDSFEALIHSEIKKKLKKDRKLVIRIHDSGDFYDKAYFKKWVEISKSLPDVTFYAYTKMNCFKNLRRPGNFVLILSEGSRSDKNIDRENDRHARVFKNEAELEQAGYVNAMTDDLQAIGKNMKIGLVYHGVASKTWTTGKEQL